VPRISEFYGVLVYMYYSDHAPPHFHAGYSGDEAMFGIRTLEVRRGQLPRRATALILERAALHRAALLDDWDLARQGLAPRRIAPLD